MRQWMVLIFALTVAFGANAKCTGESLLTTTPTKLLVYHTDKSHLTAYATYPITYARDQFELSESETLFHISHGKKKDKLCSLHLAKSVEKFSLKQKEYLVVKSADFKNDVFTMNLDHKSFTSIKCTGVTTIQDLKDVMEPYLLFNCKDRMAYQKTSEAMKRLPASK